MESWKFESGNVEGFALLRGWKIEKLKMTSRVIFDEEIFVCLLFPYYFIFSFLSIETIFSENGFGIKIAFFEIGLCFLG